MASTTHSLERSRSKTVPSRAGTLANGVITDGDAVEIATIPPPYSTSRLGRFTFPTVVLLSLGMSAGLYTLFAPLTKFELSTVSRSLNEEWQVLGFLAQRIMEIGVPWFAGYDSTDLLALTTLTHLPPLSFLSTFHTLTPRTLSLTLLIDLLSLTTPFHLLRPTSPYHNPRAPRSALPNRYLIHTRSVRWCVSALGLGVYSTVLYASYATWLPVFVVGHFDGLRTLETVHGANLLGLLFANALVGWAAFEFLFSPSVAAASRPIKSSKEVADEKRVPRGVWRKVKYAFGFRWIRKEDRVLVKRAMVLVGGTTWYTWNRLYLTIEGSDGVGALGYAGVWAGAALLTSLAYRWVRDA